MTVRFPVAALVLALWPGLAAAESPEPMVAVPGYEKSALVGDWFAVAATPSLINQDCHGTTVSVAPREDTRLVFKMACHKGSVSGKVLPIEGILAETAPGIFELRFVHLSELGGVTLVVLWQAADDSLTVIGAPDGKVGWIWSKTAHPDPQALEAAKAVMAKYGYNPRFIADVDQGM